MYLEYWGFKEFPFNNVADPNFFYLSKSHGEALTRLIYAAEKRKSGAMLSGEVGCGKTILSKVFIRELSRDKYDIGLIINPKLESNEFLQEILYQFDINDIPDSKAECHRVLNERMVENMRENKETLLIIDDAQLLDESAFEVIKLLINSQANDKFLMTIILLGQSEMRAKIKNIEQLDQGITIKYHLRPFNFEDTVRYIIFRQNKAGNNVNIFSKEAIKKIYEYSRGVPRKINSLCDLSLLIGFSQNEKRIAPKIIENIISDGGLF